MTVVKQVLIVLAGLAMAAVMVMLGSWQLRVYHLSGAQSAAEQAAAPALQLRDVARPGQAIGEGFGRTVQAQGTYDPRLQLLIPPTSPGGSYRVLSGLRQGDGSIVPVVRGIVATSSAPPPPAGAVTQTGVLLPSEDNAPSRVTPPDQIDAVRLPVLAQRWPGQLVTGYLTLSAGDAVEQQLAPAPLSLPEARGRLRNAAYAYQWWLFAAFTVAMAVRMARDLRRSHDLEAIALEEAVESPT